MASPIGLAIVWANTFPRDVDIVLHSEGIADGRDTGRDGGLQE